MSSRGVDADAFNAFEAEGWDRRAGGYVDFLGHVTVRAVEPLLDAAEVGAGTRLLDVMSGPGYVAAAAAERGASVVGVDVAPGMVALAERLHPGFDFRRGDVEGLDLDSGSFDAVTGGFGLLHLGRPERAAAELARVLAPGGRVALSVWDRPERTRLLGVVIDAVAEAGAETPDEIPVGPPFFRFADDAEFARLLEEAGLDRVRVETISFLHQVDSADELWDGLLASTVRTAALIERQAPADRARIRAAFDRIVADYAVGHGLELPVSVKLGSGAVADA
jgi:ubiquinone/menaquinone biosynthesis C-methylase UbiE